MLTLEYKCSVEHHRHYLVQNSFGPHKTVQKELFFSRTSKRLLEQPVIYQQPGDLLLATYKHMKCYQDNGEEINVKLIASRGTD